MELDNNEHVQKTEDDRLSNLTDDLLLSILERLDIFTRARTCVLSTRWRHLPWLLPELNLDVTDFFCGLCPDPIETQHRDQAMASLSKATRSFMVRPHMKWTKRKLSIKLYIGNRLCYIGSLVNNTIDRGVVKKLDLAIIDETESPECSDEDMRQNACGVNALFSACSSLLHCVTKLCLTNARFAECDMHHVLFDCCKQLQHLELDNCDTGYSAVWKINVPDSKLIVLEIYSSHLKRLDVLCLPKLERFHAHTWGPYDAPPEIKQLWTAFKKLKRLSLRGIYVEFDLFWTTILLEAAPSIEIFDIQIFEHSCMIEDGISIGEQRPKPSWKIPNFTCPNKWQLKELHVVGFRPLEQQMSFLRAMMEQAMNLKKVLLKEDKETCEDCEAMETRPPPMGGTFPRDKDEQDAIVKQLRDGANSLSIIIFDS